MFGKSKKSVKSASSTRACNCGGDCDKKNYNTTKARKSSTSACNKSTSSTNAKTSKSTTRACGKSARSVNKNSSKTNA